MKNTESSRRRFLKIGATALAMIPVLTVSGQAAAATNAALRTALKYQDKPEGAKNCANCIQFVAGPSAKDLGGCKVLPGDTEIAPQAYCMVWAKKA